jgi:hypothetical protein
VNPDPVIPDVVVIAEPEPTNPNIADLLTPRQRVVVYALLRFFTGAWAAVVGVVAGVTQNVWAVSIPTIVIGVAAAAGFTLSRANTPATP